MLPNLKFLSKVLRTIHKIQPEIQNGPFCCQKQNVNHMHKNKRITVFSLNFKVSAS